MYTRSLVEDEGARIKSESSRRIKVKRMRVEKKEKREERIEKEKKKGCAIEGLGEKEKKK